jgi:hypothetical protein
MRGRNHDSKLALILKSTAVVVACVSSNAYNQLYYQQANNDGLTDEPG